MAVSHLEEMEAAWQGFEIYQRDPVRFWAEVLGWPREWIWQAMQEMARSVRDNPKTAVRAGHGTSKELDIETPILTDKGFVRMGDIVPGMVVYSESGSRCPVVGVSPVTVRPRYRVVFDDGAEIVTSGDHLWAVHDFLSRKSLRRRGVRDYRDAWDSSRPAVTEWVAAHLRHHGQRNVSIPTCSPLVGSDHFPWPYTLGVWLAEGTSTTGQVCLNDQDAADILSGIKAEGFHAGENVSQRDTHCSMWCVYGLRPRLRALGVLGNKHVPDEAIRWDRASRLRLLMGYMDGDGWWHRAPESGSAIFCTTSRDLSDSMGVLVSSFGWKVHTHEYDATYQLGTRRAYTTLFTPSESVFTVSRKKEFCGSSSQSVRRTCRMVTDVEPLDPGPVRCIAVDSPRHLFLAGRHLIPTHNTFTLSGLALWFLYSFPPATVVTTAPTQHQVEDLLWREIRQHHSKSGKLFGEAKTLKLDLQPETGLKWFATGFSTRPDTVTAEATAFQGYHNDNVLLIFDEAAGIVPEIWRAAEHIGGNRTTRFIAVGNPTSAAGDFVRSFKDPGFQTMSISVRDTPNYKEGCNRIPGVYGREYEQRIIQRYGLDSDEYRVRVMGDISRKYTPGAYYAGIIQWLREQRRIGQLPFIAHWPVYTVWDPGFTTAIWFLQMGYMGQVRFIRYYEDQGMDLGQYAQLLADYSEQYGYRYGQHFAPVDVDNNQYKIASAEGLLALAQRAGITFTVLPFEKTVHGRIEQTAEFLRGCWFDQAGCEIGLDRLAAYHQGVNLRMSTEDRIVFTGRPEKDGNDHAADAMGYCRLAVPRITTSGVMPQGAWGGVPTGRGLVRPMSPMAF